MREGASWVFGRGTVREILESDETQAFLGHPAASDVLAERGTGRARVPLRRLARGGRPKLVAGATARPTGGDHRLAVHVAVRVRRLAGPRRCETGARDARRRGRVPTPARTVDRGLARVRRVARGPGAVRARMEGAPRLRRGAWRPALRRHPDLRLARRRGPPRPPAALPQGRGRGGAAGSVREDRPALGQPALRLARDAR